MKLNNTSQPNDVLDWMPGVEKFLAAIALTLALGGSISLMAQTPDNPATRAGGAQGRDAGPPSEGAPGFDGPPPFEPGGFGPGGFGPDMMQRETKLLKQFDKDGDGRLNNEERKPAREFAKQNSTRGFGGMRGRGGPPGGFGGFGGSGGSQEPPQPGPKLAPADVKSFGDTPIYDPQVLRTFFLEFENADWEKELADFNNTDVEVPAKLTVDGKTYLDIGVHFRGLTSFMMVPEGRKRSLNLSLDFVHKKQQLGGYRTFNLLNSAEDSTFLRTVLYYLVARDYFPAPKANYVRVVINGESWGVYVNVQQFNKDFVQENFGTAKGPRWKVPGSPNGRGGLNYLGEDAAPYKGIFEIKTKDDPKSWADLIQLCKVLNETPADKLEEALAPRLDIDGVLKYMALDNALVNNDGFWTRASDYSLCQDEKGRFHIIPNDVNETFSEGGGPGGPGGRGGRGGPGGRGGFGPGLFLAPQMFTQADQNKDQKLTKEEFIGLADTWFDKLDSDKAGKLTQEQFTAKLGILLAPPEGSGLASERAPADAPRPGGQRGGFNPAMAVGPGFFTAADTDKNDSLNRAEFKNLFAKWHAEWDAEKSGALNEEKLLAGLNAVLPMPNFGGRGRGGPGFGGGPGGGGVELDPLVSAKDTNKPLISKLLAVPALRTRYLGYVRDIAEKWLDWNKLGPLAQQYQAVIAADVKIDTRKIFTTEAFLIGLAGEAQGEGGVSAGRQTSSLKSFAEKRRAFLLNHSEVKKASR